MRTIKLTHEEIETIKMALQFVFDNQLSIIANHRKMIDEKTISSIRESANKYFDTQAVFDGERDV